MFMAASLGVSRDTYSYLASSLFFPPLLTDNSAALEFPPPAMADLQELDAVRPSEYHSPPPVAFAGGAADNEMNMSCTGVDDAVRRSGNHGCSRIGFRMRSEVDVLDDGFKWRKYGKKALKSSPNPRNYYRCSAEGCGVKKRVERESDDPRYVLTTYDGVHNHATPGAGYPICHGASPAACAAPAWGVPAGPPAAGLAAPPANAWGPVQLHAAAAAHSSESSYWSITD